MEGIWLELQAELLGWLADADDQLAGRAVADLPERLREPLLLTVADADKLIEWGRRNHCHIGAGELVLEKGYAPFVSVTGPQRKPMAQFLRESLAEDCPPDIKMRVRVTAAGRVEHARLLTSTTAPPSNGAAAAPEAASSGGKKPRAPSGGIPRPEAIRCALLLWHGFEPGMDHVPKFDPMTWTDVKILTGQHCSKNSFLAYLNERLGAKGNTKYKNACANKANLLRVLDKLCNDLEPDTARAHNIDLNPDEHYSGRPDSGEPNSNGRYASWGGNDEEGDE